MNGWVDFCEVCAEGELVMLVNPHTKSYRFERYTHEGMERCAPPDGYVHAKGYKHDDNC